MHEESSTQRKVDDDVHEGAVPAHLMDRETTTRAKILSNTIKQKRKEKAGKWEMPLRKPTKVTDTSAAQTRKGEDIQSIAFERLNVTRQSYRLTRLEQYRNYENILLSGKAVDKVCEQVEKGGNYYEFFYNERSVKPTILHFQLRNLVWATSKHDVYLISNDSLMHWSSISRNLSEVLNFSGRIVPTEVRPVTEDEMFCDKIWQKEDQAVEENGYKSHLCGSRVYQETPKV